MSILKSAVKYKAVKNVTDKAVGGGVISTVAATKIVKKSNEHSRKRRSGKK
ncbi:hypothetical protein I6N95_24895 [Vagococcus sp. BWB3-3]|uniref:Uncharacterized protein n=1 Tax=Vagococcus allomyrinae TaxID=2794353 RepID=A0A940SXE7_9ENTE|nr:hypothetical protein [Vagococcus allomyrinae]MBP1044250.1 hypothetical protein [Vagococcus allomyrinae]